MIRYYLHSHNYLEVTRCYRAIYESPLVSGDAAKWKPVSSHAAGPARACCWGRLPAGCLCPSSGAVGGSGRCGAVPAPASALSGKAPALVCPRAGAWPAHPARCPLSRPPGTAEDLLVHRAVAQLQHGAGHQRRRADAADRHAGGQAAGRPARLQAAAADLGQPGDHPLGHLPVPVLGRAGGAGGGIWRGGRRQARRRPQAARHRAQPAGGGGRAGVAWWLGVGEMCTRLRAGSERLPIACQATVSAEYWLSLNVLEPSGHQPSGHQRRQGVSHAHTHTRTRARSPPSPRR
jgi:hypothetical protein